MKKTFESINKIFKNISNSQGDQKTDKADETVEENDDDDDFFSNEVFIAAVAELEKATIKTAAKSTEAPSFSLGLTPTPIEGGHQSPQEIFDEYVHYFIYLFCV